MLVDDHEMVRMGLRSLLTVHEHIEIVAEVASSAQCLALVMQAKPDVLLLDIRLPDGSGLEICRIVNRQLPATRIIMLTSYDDDLYVQEAFSFGASGYILKNIRAQNLLNAIEAVYEGKTILDPKISEKALHRIKESTQEETLFNSLTETEKQILSYISEGLKNKEIADRLNLKEKTVRNYVSQVLEKLQLHKRAEAAAFVIRHQLEKK